MNNIDESDSFMLACERRSEQSIQRARVAFQELLHLAETRDSGQIRRIAEFIAATYNGDIYCFDLFELRCLDVKISDHILVCLDCLRWGGSDLYRLAPDGDARVRAVIARWDLKQTTKN
jgi:hypothetical protein